MTEISKSATGVEALLDAIDTLSYASRGVRYIKNEYPETKDFDHNQMFSFIFELMNNPSKLNALVMGADPVVLSSIRHFIAWYATSADSDFIATEIRGIRDAKIGMLALTYD